MPAQGARLEIPFGYPAPLAFCFDPGSTPHPPLLQSARDERAHADPRRDAAPRPPRQRRLPRRRRDDTRIRRSYLEALEAEDLDALPPSVYTRGFVRTYAEYLGLNRAAMVDLYQPPEQREPSPPLQPAVPRVAMPRAIPLRPVLYGLRGIAFVAVLVVAWNFYQGVQPRCARATRPHPAPRHPDRARTPADDQPARARLTQPQLCREPTVAPAPAAVVPSPSPTAVVDGILVEFRATTRVYVEAAVDGQQVIAETVPAGTERALPLGKNWSSCASARATPSTSPSTANHRIHQTADRPRRVHMETLTALAGAPLPPGHRSAVPRTRSTPRRWNSCCWRRATPGGQRRDRPTC